MPDNLLDWPWERLSIVSLLGIGLVAFVRRWVVAGVFYTEVKAERDAAIEKGDANNKLVERMLDVIERREQAERERR